MNLLYCVILILRFVLDEYNCAQFVLPPINLDEYDAYGSLLAVNEYLAVIAQNDQEHFTIITNPFTNRSKQCTLLYNTIQHSPTSLTRFVYNVAIGAKQNANQLFFSYIDESWQRDVFLTIIFLEPTNIGCVRAVNRSAVNITALKMQEHALVGMDPHGIRAYAVGTYYIVCVEVKTGLMWQLDTEKFTDSQDYFGNLFFPKALVVTEDQYIFAVGQRLTNLRFLPYLIVLNSSLPDNTTMLSVTELSKFNFGPSSIDFTRYSTMSISLLDQVEQFIIGIPQLDMLLFLSWNLANASEAPVILRKHVSSQRGILFGKSVALLDSNTFAVLAYALPTQPWSLSQVQVYSFHDENPNSRPLTVYPNNQQVIPTLNLVSPPHSILTIVSWKLHLGLVLDAGAALLLSASPPGYCSSRIDDSLSDMGVYTSVPCIPGTARSTTSFGPCFLCPPNTKNNGTSGIECEPCVTDNSLLCLRGSLVEISLDNVTNYNQAVLYPDSPDLIEFDDLLLDNIFSFMTTPSRCLVNSPLFWASLAAGLGFIVFIVMCILMCFPKWKPQRTFLKKLFTHLDLIGEGEMWFGGLVTFAIVVLLAFTCKFSVSFARRYPMETVASDDQAVVSCESTLFDAKFTSALQLLSTIRNEEEKRIFTMLDEQDITLNVDLVSTGFLCDSVLMQQNLDRGQRVPSNDFNCSFDEETSILSVSTLLPQHLVVMQFDLTGPYFIGGLRICLSGPSRIKDDGKNTLQELRFCQFFYIDNETLTSSPTIDVKMTKAINRTVGFDVDDELTFSGIWVPTLTVNTLSDVLLFGESGEYIRYLSDRVTLVVHMTESEFFMKNTQEPIARRNEIILHTILFSIVFLEFFGLFFLLVKLILIPLAQLIQRRFFSNRYRSSMESKEEQIQLARFIELHVDEVPKKSEIMQNPTERVSDAPMQTNF